jgi:hypothetical protein
MHFGGALQTKTFSKSHVQILDFPDFFARWIGVEVGIVLDEKKLDQVHWKALVKLYNILEYNFL